MEAIDIFRILCIVTGVLIILGVSSGALGVSDSHIDYTMAGYTRRLDQDCYLKLPSAEGLLFIRCRSCANRGTGLTFEK